MAAMTSRANQQYKSLNFPPACPDYPWYNYEREFLYSEVCSLKCCQLYPSIYVSQITIQSLQNGTSAPIITGTIMIMIMIIYLFIYLFWMQP